jgi:hypothetical protein
MASPSAYGYQTLNPSASQNFKPITKSRRAKIQTHEKSKRRDAALLHLSMIHPWTQVNASNTGLRLKSSPDHDPAIYPAAFKAYFRVLAHIDASDR